MRPIEQWLESKPKNTRRNYLAVWELWLTYLGQSASLEIKPERCQAFVNNLADNSSSNTVKNRIYALRSIYAYLIVAGVVKTNPWQYSKHYFSMRQSAQVRPTATITSIEVGKILASFKDPESFKEIQTMVIAYAFFSSGCRRSEVHRLTLADIQVYDEVLVLNLKYSKSGRSEPQPVANFAKELILKFVSLRSGQGATDSDPLFISCNGKRMSETTLYRRFKEVCKANGIDAAPHAARAAYATNMLSNNVPHEEVARALRHKDPRSVKPYDHRRRALKDNKGIDVEY